MHHALKDATCTEKGKTEGKHCEVCNEVLVAQEEVAALGHTESEWIVTEDGTRKYVECTVCHIELKSENIETSEKPSEEPSTEPSETPSEEPSTEPQVPTDTPEKGCKGSTIGIISIASLLGLLFLKKKQK